MHKFLTLIAALAVAAAVQTSPPATAQTAAASKDDGATTTLSAAQQKRAAAAPVRAAPVRSAPTRSVSRPTSTTRSVSRSTTSSRSVAKTTRSSTGKTAVGSTKTGKTAVTSTKTGKTAVGSTKTGKTAVTSTKTGKTAVTSTKTGKTAVTSTKTGKTAVTSKIGKTGKTGLTQGPGKTGKTSLTSKTGKTKLTQGPNKTKTGKMTKGPQDKSKVAKVDGKRRVAVNRDRRRIFHDNHWATLVPLVALGTFVVGAETLYAEGYIPVEEPVCTGYSEDGSLMRWMAVPTEDGGSEYQCVAYSPQRNRVITEIVVPETPLAEAPPVAEPETVGVGPANEPAAAAAPPAAPATGCELLIYSEANFKGISAPADENQPNLSEDGWQNEIASIEIKSGTWDFYSDEDYAGEMMRLSAGVYPTLDPKWSKNIGSFMCSAPAK